MSSDVRKRRRSLEERVGAVLRHSRPGDLSGRSEPLPRDGGGRGRVSGGPGGGADPGTQIEHVTAYAAAGQTVAAGAATIQWDREAGPPTERRGFERFSAQLAADGSVGAIPIDVAGLGIAKVLLVFDAEYTGTVEVIRTRSFIETTLELYAGTGDVFYEAVDLSALRADDTVAVKVDPGAEATVTKGRVQMSVWTAADATTPPPVAVIGSWAAPADPNGIDWDGTHLWIASHDADGTVSAYTRSGTLAASFTTGIGPDKLQGLTVHGPDFWVTNEDTSVNNVIKVDSSGAVLTSIKPRGATAPEMRPMSVEFDGTDLWIGYYDGTVVKVTTAGTVLATHAGPGGIIQGLHWTGTHMLVTVANSNIVHVYDSSWTLVATVEIPGTQSGGSTAGTQGIVVVDGIAFVANNNSVHVYLVSGFGGY